jgi:hypothetical protein
MNVGQFLSHPQMSYHSSILSLESINEGPCALMATKTKSNLSQGQEATLLKGPTFLPHVHIPMGRLGCLSLKTSTFKPCRIIRQLGSGLDSVDGVKAVFVEPTCRLR